MARQQQNWTGGLSQAGDPTHIVQGERCIQVKGGWWPIRFGEPPEHIRLPQQNPAPMSWMN